MLTIGSGIENWCSNMTRTEMYFTLDREGFCQYTEKKETAERMKAAGYSVFKGEPL